MRIVPVLILLAYVVGAFGICGLLALFGGR